MKDLPGKVLLLFITLPFMLGLTSSAFAGKLNVPGDFPGNFTMDLLAINLFVDNPAAGMGMPDATLNSEFGGIAFSASGFDGTGTPDWGTSSLNTMTNNFQIGHGDYFENDLQFFIDGAGTGALTDNGNGSGDWELTTPAYAMFGGIHSLNDLTLSTSNIVSYYDQAGNLQFAGGTAMNYDSGDAVLVGQVIAQAGSPFEGLRGTFVIQANDPLTVPEPSSILLIGSGLAGLLRFRKRK